MNEQTRKKLILAIYVMTIFFALHSAIPYFILSKFLSEYFETMTISLIFILAGLLSILANNYLTHFLKKYKDYKTFLTICLLQILITFLIPFFAEINSSLLIMAFLMHIVLVSLIWAVVNIFLEEFSPNDKTGRIRGLQLTIFYFGIILAPFIAGKVFIIYNYFGVFILSSLAILPIIFYAREYLRNIPEPKYQHRSFLKALKQIKHNTDLKGVFLSSFMLNSFYAVMNIYLVIYLLNVIQIPITYYLGIIVPVFLLPFVLLPMKLGQASDEFLGEKKVMIFGLLIFSLTLLYIYFVDINSILAWTIILFISRIGAALNEIENYTYFYKKIKVENADLIVIFQNMNNIALIFVSALGFILINLFDISILTLVLIIGLMGLVSVVKILHIHDTIQAVRLKTQDSRQNI